MARTARDHLLDALEDLEEEQLKKFKWKLNEIPLREGFANIPRGRLQKADALDLCDLLVSYYTASYGVQVAAQVLEGIQLRREAERLRTATESERNHLHWKEQESSSTLKTNTICVESGSVQTPVQSSCGLSGRHGPRELASMEPHFIDRYRAELIQRTSTVEAVLDLLYGSILDDEQYERIISEKTSQDKMRELYKLVPSWDRQCKDQLYKALKAKNKFLVQDLEGR